MAPWLEDATRRRVALGALALCAALGSVLVRQQLLPLSSWNSDEAVYLFQAEMFLDGGVTLPAELHDEPFRLWLSGERGGRVFMAYQPGFPAVLAVSGLVVGSTSFALAALAAWNVVAVHGLAQVLWGDRRVALGSSALVAVSPMFVLHSGLYLSYLPTVAVLLSAGWCALRAAELRSGWRMAASGSLIGGAVLMRPYDALLFVLPLAPLVIRRARLAGAGRADVVRLAATAVAGALPALAVTAWFNDRTTGSPTEFPITALGGPNTFGFGTRRIMTGEPAIDYDAVLALESLWENLAAVPSWTFGGVLLLLLGVWGVTRPGHGAERLVVAGLVLVYPLGYLFWWASELSSRWVVNEFGPYYYLPSLVAVAMLAARGLVHVADALGAPMRVAMVVVLLVAVTIPALPDKLSYHLSTTERFRNVSSAVPADLSGAVVLLDTRHLLYEHPYFVNDPSLEGDVLFALGDADAAEALADRFPDRVIYRLEVERADGADARLVCALESTC